MQTLTDNIVGTGFRLSVKPDYKALGKSVVLRLISLAHRLPTISKPNIREIIGVKRQSGRGFLPLRVLVAGVFYMFMILTALGKRAANPF